MKRRLLRWDEDCSLFAAVYFVVAALSFNSLTAGYALTKALAVIVLIWGVAALARRIMNGRQCRRDGILLVSVLFFASAVVSTLLNLRYGFLGNVKMLIWMALELFLLRVVLRRRKGEDNSSSGLVDRGWEILNRLTRRDLVYFTVLAVTFLQTLVSVIMLLLNYSGADIQRGQYIGLQLGRLWGSYSDPNYGATLACCSIAISVGEFLRLIGERNRAEGNRVEGNRAEGNHAEGNRVEGNHAEGNRAEESRVEGNRAEGNRSVEEDVRKRRFKEKIRAARVFEDRVILAVKCVLVLNIFLQYLYIVFSFSRTGQICLILEALCFGVLAFLAWRKRGFAGAGRKALAQIAVGVAVSVLLLGPGMNWIRAGYNAIYHRDITQSEISEEGTADGGNAATASNAVTSRSAVTTDGGNAATASNAVTSRSAVTTDGGNAASAALLTLGQGQPATPQSVPAETATGTTTATAAVTATGAATETAAETVSDVAIETAAETVSDVAIETAAETVNDVATETAAGTEGYDGTIGRDDVSEDDISNGRFEIWKEGVQIWETRPIFGISYRNIEAYTKANFPDGYMSTRENVLNTFHNVFVDVLVSQGLVGELIFLVLLALILYSVLTFVYKQCGVAARTNRTAKKRGSVEVTRQSVTAKKRGSVEVTQQSGTAKKRGSAEVTQQSVTAKKRGSVEVTRQSVTAKKRGSAEAARLGVTPCEMSQILWSCVPVILFFVIGASSFLLSEVFYMNTPTAVLFWFSLSLIPGVIPRGRREDARRAIHLAAIFIFVMLAVINIWYHTKTQISSDTVTMLPVAEDFLSGNWLLKHWILGTNNFFFTETIFYAVGMALGFSRQAMIGSITCLFYSATVVLMAIFFLIRDDGYEGLPWNTRVKLAACFVPTVGICAWPMAYTLLNANSHNNLYFFMCFCILFLLAWMRERKRWCLIAYFLLGVILVFSEGFATMTLIGPVILFGLWSAVFDRKRRWRGVMLAAVSVAAWLAAKAVGAIISAAGGLVTLGLPMGLVFSPRTLASRVYHFLIISEKFFYTGTLEFLGLHLPEGIYHAIAIAGIVIFLAGLVIALFRVMKLSDIDRLLLIIVVLNLAGCFFFDVDIHFRYLVPTWIFGSIVSLKQLFLLAHAVLGDRERVMKGLYVTLALCTAFTTAKKLATINDNLVAGEKERDVVAYLEDNHYGAGYGVFWASSNISYYSDNGLDIKPIIIDGEGVYKYFELIRDDWYQWNDRRYFIIKKDEQARYDRFIRLYIGEPLDIATIHEYVIYRWADDFTGLLEEYDREAKARGE